MTARAVPHEVIPCDNLPPPRYRDLPDPPSSWRRLVGPSILLLGLSIGSGEFVLWPYITYKFGFVVFLGMYSRRHDPVFHQHGD